MTSGYYWAVDKNGSKYVCRYDAKTERFQFIGSKFNFTKEELDAMNTKFYKIREPEENDNPM